MTGRLKVSVSNQILRWISTRKPIRQLDVTRNSTVPWTIYVLENNERKMKRTLSLMVVLLLAVSSLMAGEVSEQQAMPPSTQRQPVTPV